MKFPQLRKVGRAFYFDTQAKPRKWIPLGSDEALAMRRYHELRGEKAPASSGDSVDRMLDDYVRSIAGSKLAAGTRRQYGFFLIHLSRVFGHMTASSVTQADVARYLEECPRTGARGEIAVLSSAYRRWMRLGRLDFNPCIGARCEKPRSARDRLLSLAELNALLKEAKPPIFGLAIELAYATGLRVSDLVALRWDNFVEEDAIQVETRKTGARLRFILDDGLRDLLSRARSTQGRIASLYVLSQHRGRPLRPATIRRWFHEACARAGIEDAQWRDIRAAAGTEVDRLGGDATAFLGHRSRATTRIYLRGKRIVTVAPLRLVRG